VTWFGQATRLAWATERTPAAAVVVYYELPMLEGQLVALAEAPSWDHVAEMRIPVDPSGCAVEGVAASPSGRWAATQRSSGQGECGFDVIDLESMERVGGVIEMYGYIFEPPAFAADEARVVACWAHDLGAFWAPDGYDEDEPSPGGVVELGALYEHRLDSHSLHTCALELEVPEGWLPDDPYSPVWYGPTGLKCLEGGLRMVLPGGDIYEHGGPLPAVLRLPPLSAFGTILE